MATLEQSAVNHRVIYTARLMRTKQMQHTSESRHVAEGYGSPCCLKQEVHSSFHTFRVLLSAVAFTTFLFCLQVFPVTGTPTWMR